MVCPMQAQLAQTKYVKPRTLVAEGKALLCGIQASNLVSAEDLPIVLTKVCVCACVRMSGSHDLM